jgi:hypothetical protein
MILSRIDSPRTVIFCFLSSLTCYAAVLSAEETSNEVFLMGYHWSSSPTAYSYWIAPALFPGRVSWNPGKEPFPLALDTEVHRADSWLTQQKQLTNALTLHGIEIGHTVTRRKPGPAGNEDCGFMNGWTVALKFHDSPQPPAQAEDYQVVMLLDGTYATERRRPKNRSERETESATFAAAERPELGYSRPARRPVKSENPLELVHRADFRVPQVQWSPADPFPMDLSAMAEKTRTELLQTYGMPEDLALEKIELEPFLPDGAVPDLLQRLLQHRWHWIVAFRYASTVSSWPRAEYDVYLLLDGRILTVHVPDTAPASSP